MNPRVRGLLKLSILLAVFVGLFLLFPRAYFFMQMAARELRYFWWVILLLGLSVWLIWGIGRKPDK
jgi:uncharacterized membrane-anchored protein